ncbi:MAG: hypothetical protein ND866_07285 [Pyrinomonadaceae bacterium]|nr:hypothetical protein [Pyrinomonadaceae bacterium]
MQKRLVLSVLLASALVLLAVSAPATASRTRWRAANESELRRIIPARASVLAENIETEFRTASGVTDGKDRFIAGVVMITAGYSAEGKYSHFFITQAPLSIGNTLLHSGEYVLGSQRTSTDVIRVSFYRASNGEMLGDVDARINRKSSAVRSLLIMPPVGGKALIQIGRFTFEYRLAE